MIKSKNKISLNYTSIKQMSFALAAASLLVFTGCKKDDDETPVVVNNPVIAVTSPTDGDSKMSGSTVNLAFSVTNDNGLKRVVIKYKSSMGTEVTKLDTALTTQPNSFSFSRNYTVGAIGTETYTISVTDKKDNIQTKSINVKSYTGFAEESFGTIFHILGSNPGAFDLSKGEQRSNSDADADKDMVNNDAAGVFTGGWEAKNSTMYVRAASFNYATGTVMDAQKAYAAGTPDSKVVAPANGEIFIAKLRGSETYTIIKIIANEPLNAECGCSNKGKLTFNLKKSI